MMWYSLFTVLWVTSVSAFVLRLNDDGSPQTPFLHGESDTPCAPGAGGISTTADLPVVDLGYAKHKAVANPNPMLYKFQNIRYAAPPTGKLRFKAPQPPLDNESGKVEDGSGRKECLQATIKWGENFPDEDCKDCECCEEENDNGSCEKPCSDKERSSKSSNKKLLGGLLPKNLTDPDFYSEDCLFLDVWTPKDVFDKRDQIPVFVWIYGGAYIFGGKSLYFPGGLLDRAFAHGGDGMIFVSMNYRMGALGFAAGKDIEDEDINAGILDQQQALLWVQEHIAKFGGDPEQVTIAGLSAGGGSVLHHITAYGGDRPTPFQRAISFSGGWQPITNKTSADNTFKDFMKKYNDVSTIDELRDVSDVQMMNANFKQIYESPPGSFSYNPTAWGEITPKSPTKLVDEGSFAQNVDVMLSNVFDEGGQFISAFKERKTTVAEFVDLAFPDVSDEEKDWILETYNDPETPDAEDIGRIIGDVTFRCHATYLSDAKDQAVWRQRWNTIDSNGHGGDLTYLFYQPLVPVQSIRSARILQDYVVTFALYGEPSTLVRNPWPAPQPRNYYMHAVDGRVQYFDTGFAKLPKVWRGDTEVEELCRIWQRMDST